MHKTDVHLRHGVRRPVRSWIIPLGAEGADDSTLVGRKAAALDSLLKRGFPVPPGVCMTTGPSGPPSSPFMSG